MYWDSNESREQSKFSKDLGFLELTVWCKREVSNMLVTSIRGNPMYSNNDIRGSGRAYHSYVVKGDYWMGMDPWNRFCVQEGKRYER